MNDEHAPALPLKHSVTPSWLAAGLGWAAAVLTALPMGAAAQDKPQEFSRAERLLLMSPQLGAIKPPATLNYRFRKTGTLEETFDDQVGVKLERQADGRCCKASGEFLTGARRLDLAEIEQAEGNPVIVYYLEHDIRAMQRRTKGSANYFRKRIRMALYEGARITDLKLTYRGKPIDAQAITIEPYRDDPNRARFAQLALKRYVFVLSDAVPGSVVSIRSTAAAEGSTAPLIDEELLLDGAEAPAAAPSS